MFDNEDVLIVVGIQEAGSEEIAMFDPPYIISPEYLEEWVEEFYWIRSTEPLPEGEFI